MIRRLLDVAAVLSLVLAVLLAIAGVANKPRLWRHIAGTIEVGTGAVWGGHSQTFGVPLVGIPLVVLAIGFALFPLVWGLVQALRWARQCRARGFPIEPGN